MNNSLFIEPKTLKSKINKPNVKILDATFFLPDSGLNAEEEYQKKLNLEYVLYGTLFQHLNQNQEEKMWHPKS